MIYTVELWIPVTIQYTSFPCKYVLSLQEISKKLFRILENVNRAYDRYKRDDGTDPKVEKEYNNLLTWEEKSRRSHLLDEIDDVLNINMGKLLDLRIVLDSLKECSKFCNTSSGKGYSDKILSHREVFFFRKRGKSFENLIWYTVEDKNLSLLI